MRKRERRERSRENEHRRGQARREEGQAMVEMTLCIVFLLLVVVALFEFAMVFYAYISLENAVRVGCAYATIWPNEVIAHDPTHWPEYVNRTMTEIEAAGLVTTEPTLEIETPFLPQTPPCDDDVCTITCVVNYEVVNETQGLFLPLLGRLGLFQSAIVTARWDPSCREPNCGW